MQEDVRKVAITNVNSHAFGVLGVEPSTGRPRNRVMIPRNTALPFSKRKRFATSKQGQRSVVVKIIEGGDASGNDSTPIGRCVIRNLPAELPAGTRVDVSFNYSNNGRLTVHAAMRTASVAVKVDLERCSGLKDAEIDEWGRRVKNRMRPLQIEL